ncbi:unnamed protein product, partial [Staurois parvus]
MKDTEWRSVEGLAERGGGHEWRSVEGLEKGGGGPVEVSGGIGKREKDTEGESGEGLAEGEGEYKTVSGVDESGRAGGRPMG